MSPAKRDYVIPCMAESRVEETDGISLPYLTLKYIPSNNGDNLLTAS